ncbi:MAG TPA: hypothetical protein VNK95_25135 [Caldilineaceae bacterium]|nr:hypothetical protein [Caldilineaceae bacterium]
MGLIDRFQALFRPRDRQTQPATLMTPPIRPWSLAARFNVERDRRAMVEDARRMYDEDPRARAIIQTLARDTVKNGFELHVEGPRAREATAIATDLLERVDFWSRIDDWVRLTLRDGDSFLEVAANPKGDIVHVSRKPALEMHVWADEFGQFIDPARAYFWTDALWVSDTPPGDAVFFAEWQIIQASWDKDEGNRYGRPLLASARKAYKRMSEGELDIAIRRKTRAGMKYVHSLEDASEAEIEAYKRRNQAALDDPFAAVADFFSNKRTSIQGDARLSEIEDVLHHIRTFWLASPVPMSLLGYGQDLNRDVLDEQEEQYRRTLEQASAWVTGQFVKPLLERQWLLRGIWPGALTWSAAWAAKEPATAESLAEVAKALVALRATNLLTDETLLRLLSHVLPDFDVEAELAALQAARPDEVTRMGNLAQGAVEGEDDGDGAE